MTVSYPIFVFEIDDSSMRLIEDSRKLSTLEATDIEYDEYVFWDRNGGGISIAVTTNRKITKNKILSVESRDAVFPLEKAFSAYAKSLGIVMPAAGGTPIEIWNQIERAKQNLPKKQGLLSKLFSR